MKKRAPVQCHACGTKLGVVPQTTIDALKQRDDSREVLVSTLSAIAEMAGLPCSASFAVIADRIVKLRAVAEAGKTVSEWLRAGAGILRDLGEDDDYEQAIEVCDAADAALAALEDRKEEI